MQTFYTEQGAQHKNEKVEVFVSSSYSEVMQTFKYFMVAYALIRRVVSSSLFQVRCIPTHHHSLFHITISLCLDNFSFQQDFSKFNRGSRLKVSFSDKMIYEHKMEHGERLIFQWIIVQSTALISSSSPLHPLTFFSSRKKSDFGVPSSCLSF